MSNTSVCPVCCKNEIPKEENYWVEIVSCSGGESNSVDQVFVCGDDCVTELEGRLDGEVAAALNGYIGRKPELTLKMLKEMKDLFGIKQSLLGSLDGQVWVNRVLSTLKKSYRIQDEGIVRRALEEWVRTDDYVNDLWKSGGVPEWVCGVGINGFHVLYERYPGAERWPENENGTPVQFKSIKEFRGYIDRLFGRDNGEHEEDEEEVAVVNRVPFVKVIDDGEGMYDSEEEADLIQGRTGVPPEGNIDRIHLRDSAETEYDCEEADDLMQIEEFYAATNKRLNELGEELKQEGADRDALLHEIEQLKGKIVVHNSVPSVREIARIDASMLYAEANKLAKEANASAHASLCSLMISQLPPLDDKLGVIMGVLREMGYRMYQSCKHYDEYCYDQFAIYLCKGVVESDEYNELELVRDLHEYPELIGHLEIVGEQLRTGKFGKEYSSSYYLVGEDGELLEETRKQYSRGRIVVEVDSDNE